MNNSCYYKVQNDEVDVFNFAIEHSLPVLLKGPTGCGKTRFVEYMANQSGRQLHTVTCHDDLTSTDLIGRHLIKENGTYWQDGPLTRAVRYGGICYLDEVIEARKDTTVVLHSLSDHRRELHIERTGEVLRAHPDFMLVVSYNPSYQNSIKGLKASTRQRFIALEFDYPEPDAEAKIVSHEAQVDLSLAEKLVGLAVSLRRLSDCHLESKVSTRLLIYAAKMISSGCNIHKACLYAIVLPITDEQSTIDALIKVVDANVG